MSRETGTVEGAAVSLGQSPHSSASLAADRHGPLHASHPAEPPPLATGWISPGNTCTQPTNPAINSRTARRGCSCKVFADARDHGSVHFASALPPCRGVNDRAKMPCRIHSGCGSLKPQRVKEARRSSLHFPACLRAFWVALFAARNARKTPAFTRPCARKLFGLTPS